jgi:hypothetical protein
VGHVGRIGGIINACKIVTGKSEWKRSLRRPTHRWKEAIKINLREIYWVDVDWIHLARDRDR